LIDIRTLQYCDVVSQQLQGNGVENRSLEILDHWEGLSGEAENAQVARITARARLPE